MDFNKKGRITRVQVGGADSWVMYGPAYFSREFSDLFFPALEAYYHTPGTEQMYWEQVLLDLINGTVHEHLPGRPDFPAPEMDGNMQPDGQVYEFENLEELRGFDSRYRDHSNNEAMELISRVLAVPESEIREISCLKTGMTNKSFLFKVHGNHYICRIPGPGTGLLINRKQEKNVYDTVQGLGITDRVLYMDGESGYKISEYYEGAHVADPKNWDEVSRCMELLRKLHGSYIRVGHTFDIRERIGFYESLCAGYERELFEDYPEIRSHAEELLNLLDRLNRPKVLSHIDSVCDNFLFLPDGSLRLIDWEYAGMQDEAVDIAMVAIYALYEKDKVDELIDAYYTEGCREEVRLKIYAYIAVCGFLWSNWCEFKRHEGVEFGEYSLRQYGYAKEYYRYVKQGLEGEQ